MDEFIDIYNEENEYIGVEMKSKAHEFGLWHRVCHVWVYNSNNEVLLQLRAKCKKIYPDMWDVSVGGHIGAGEDIVDATIRETKEELGLDVNANDLEFFEVGKRSFDYKNIQNREFCYVYFLKKDINPKDLVLQEEEVAEAKFCSVDAVIKDLRSNPNKYVISDIKYWFDVLDAIKNK